MLRSLPNCGGPGYSHQHIRSRLHTQPLTHAHTGSTGTHADTNTYCSHRHVHAWLPTTKAEVNSCAQQPRRFCTLHVLCTKSLPPCLPGGCAPSAGRPLIQQHCGRGEVVPSAATSGMLTRRNAQSERLDCKQNSISPSLSKPCWRYVRVTTA